MFFSKPKSVSTSFQGSVAIIGTSPLAFLLADIAASHNFSTTIVTSPKKLKKKSLPEALIIQSFSLQNHQCRFTYSETLPKDPDFCFIASNLKDTRTDLLSLPSSFSEKTTLLNFSHLYNHNILEKLNLSYPVFTTYFESWLLLEKNTLKMLERKPEISILCHDDPTIKKIKPLFENSPISAVFLDEKKKHFWKHLAPYFLVNLLLLCNKGQKITSLLQQQNYHDQINSAAKELCLFAKQDKETLSETSIFSSLYDVPNNYQPTISSSSDFEAFSLLIPKIDRFKTPTLYNFLVTANKY